MKLVIDISKDRYDEIMAMDWKNCRRFFDEEIRAIHDGKALEQEPCDDAISRQAAIVALDNRMSSLEKVDMQIAMGFAKGIIHELPSVTPAEKVGRWKPYDGSWYECSGCGATREAVGYFENFCPNCGAKMEVEDT